VAPLRSQALLVNRYYALVLPQGHLLYAGWDRSRYGPGESARLLVRGQHLPRSFELQLERATSDGAWEFAGVVRAKTTDGVGAQADHTFLLPPPSVRTEGVLTGAEFSQTRLEQGEPVELRATASGLDGEELTFAIEREVGPDQWVEVSRSRATLEEGRCAVAFRPPRPERPEPAIEAVRFEGGAPSASLAVLLARAPHLEDAQVGFVLEREESPGHYVEAGRAVATVHDGVARATVGLVEPADG
jgi:hypothetical protein